MRNVPHNVYCNKFLVTDTYIEDKITGIRYVNRTELESENSCRQVCDWTQRLTCEILKGFTNLRVPNRNFFVEKDEFGDPKPKL